MITDDQVVLVNEHDQVIGAMDKLDAHRQNKLHRAISVYLFRKNELGQPELLMQQRSHHKIVGAHQWANTVCGNVRPGERYIDCAHRRLAVELGLTEQPQLSSIYSFTYQVKCNDEFSEHEVDRVFVGWWTNSTIKQNSDEVQEVSWVNWQQLLRTEWRKKQFNTAPWFEIMLADPTLISKLSKFVQK